MTICPNCHYDNPPEMEFCGACGARLPLPCPNCGSSNPPDFAFCGRCGARLAEEPVPATGPTPAPEPAGGTSTVEPPRPEGVPLEGERRVLTAMFADVKVSTALAGQIDTKGWVEIMSHTLQLLSAEIQRYGGEVDRYAGDGLVAFFGLSTTHEDDAERAVLAALAMQAAIKGYARELAAQQGIELLLRVGLNTGEVIATHVGQAQQHGEATAMGRTIALAARLEPAAWTTGTS